MATKPKAKKFTVTDGSWFLDAPREVKHAATADRSRWFMTVQCDECNEEATARVDAEGRLCLPSGWTWRAMCCNWAPGVTVKPMHIDCDVADEDGVEAEEVTRTLLYTPAKGA